MKYVLAATAALLVGISSLSAAEQPAQGVFSSPQYSNHNFRHAQGLSLLLEIAPELTGHGLPLSKCEAYNRVYDQFYQSR